MTWQAAYVAAMDRYRFMAGVGINAECLPYEDNRLELSDELDSFGVPKAVVRFSPGSNEKELDEHAVSTMTKILTAAGASETIVLSRTAHTTGNSRMGSDAGTAVVNSDGRSFDIENLWICDNSISPSALAANPALTIMALSLRTAEKFKPR